MDAFIPYLHPDMDKLERDSILPHEVSPSQSVPLHLLTVLFLCRLATGAAASHAF